MTDPLLGQTIGSYRVTRQIGEGGMGRVYLGEQPQIGSRVAIKVLSDECAREPVTVERFFAEARAVNLIRHEGIVNVLDLSAFADGRPFIVMEYLEGESLASLLRRQGALPLGSLSRLMLEVLSALGAAHEQGIVHRDLKPDNIFITRAGRSKILDFGVAKLRPDVSGIQDGTRTGSLLGTPHYMSPEQALGRPVDARSDLYALGVILYECATGRRPFDGGTLYELLKQHIEAHAVPPRALRPDIPPAYELLIQRALEKSPLTRFLSAGEFASALEQAMSGLSAESYAPIASGAVRSGPVGSGALGSGVGGAPTPVSPVHLSGNLNSSPGAVPGYAPPPHSPPRAYAGHVPVGHAAALPSKPTSRSPLPWIAAIGCGFLALAGVAVGVVLVLLPGRSTSIANSGGALEEPASEETGSPPLLAPGNPGLGVALFNKKSFDVHEFVPRAFALAREHHADADLVAIDVMGTNPSGIVDLTASSSNIVNYRFRSQSHSSPPADFPENAEFESNCMVYVTVMHSGITSHVIDRWDCKAPIVGRPKCTLKQVWQKAAERGAPSGNVIGTFLYNADDDGGEARWIVSVPPSFSVILPDEC